MCTISREEVEVGGERRGRGVEEHEVLHEQHQVLGRARAVPEQLLHEVLRARRRARRPTSRSGLAPARSRPRSTIDRVEVGVGRERAEVAERRELAADVAGGPAEEQPQEREPLRLVEPAGDAEVEQDRAARRAARAGCRRAGRRGTRRSSSAPSRQAMRPARRIALGVEAGRVHRRRRRRTRSPRRRSMTSTRRVTSTGCGRGTTIVRCSVAASTRARSSMFSASRRKSSSSTICSANSSTSAGGFASAATGMRPTSSGASHASARRSSRTSAATSRPLDLDDDLLAGDEAGRVHLRDRRRGERLGARTRRRPCSSGRPRSRSTTARTSANRSGGTWSRSFLNSSTQLVGEEPLERRDDLTELDVRRPEALEGAGAAGGPEPAREAGVPRSRTHHAERAAAELGDDPQRNGRPAGGGGGRAGGGPRPGCGRGSGRGAASHTSSVGVDDPRPVVGEGVLGDVGRGGGAHGTPTVRRTGDGHPTVRSPCGRARTRMRPRRGVRGHISGTVGGRSPASTADARR